MLNVDAPSDRCWRLVSIAVLVGLGAGLVLSFWDGAEHMQNHRSSTTSTSTCSPRNTPDRLSADLVRRHKCGDNYPVHVSKPMFHMASPCAGEESVAGETEEELSLSLANLMYMDCTSWCVYSIRDPGKTWWHWRPDLMCWELRGGEVCQHNKREIQHAVTLKRSFCSPSPTPSKSPSTSLVPFYNPLLHGQRRVHLSITGRLGCLGDTSYSHLHSLVHSLVSQGHQVFIYAGVSFMDQSKQVRAWDRLRKRWGALEKHSSCLNTKLPVNVQWDTTFVESPLSIIRDVGALPLQTQCVKQLNKGVPFCDATLNSLIKLKQAWLEMRSCVRPQDIIIRTRPDLMMRCHEPGVTPVGTATGKFAWGSCWPNLPVLRSNRTLVVSKHYRFGDGLEDNFAIMTKRAAETYYTLFDRIGSVMNTTRSQFDQGLLDREFGINPEMLFAINLFDPAAGLDVEMHDWVYDLQGQGNWHNNAQFC